MPYAFYITYPSKNSNIYVSVYIADTVKLTNRVLDSSSNRHHRVCSPSVPFLRHLFRLCPSSDPLFRLCPFLRPLFQVVPVLRGSDPFLALCSFQRLIFSLMCHSTCRSTPRSLFLLYSKLNNVLNNTRCVCLR